MEVSRRASALCRNPACRALLFEFNVADAATGLRGRVAKGLTRQQVPETRYTVCPACGATQDLRRLGAHADALRAHLDAALAA